MGKEKIIILSILLAILLLGAFFRFYRISEIPPGLYPDEAMNGNNALEAPATGDFKVFYPENNGREGLFINLQTLSLWAFDNEPWALRLVSALFGTLTILGVYLLTIELFGQPLGLRNTKNLRNYENGDNKLSYIRTNSYFVALLASFFLASSYWHINFSRIGFRAIMVPFFAAFGVYFLLKGLRRGKIFDLVMAGIFVGLGFHAYIAFRFMPLVLAVPIGWYLWQYQKSKIKNPLYCVPCAVLLFLFVTLLVFLPLGYHFLQNPQDFLGRAGDVSIFSAASPLKEFAVSNLKTLGMFFVPGTGGDCNWRHNLDCRPFFFMGIFGLVGIWTLWRRFSARAPLIILLSWAFFMSLPATLTREGLPHALRSIGMIPPLVILEGVGAWFLLQTALDWVGRQQIKWPAYLGQLERVRKELIILFFSLLLVAPTLTYFQYFVRWANNPHTYFAFSTDLWHLGQFLEGLPQDTKKYIVVNLPGVDIRGIPAPAQTVMFATNTFRMDKQKERNITYLNPYRGETSIVAAIEVSPQQHTVIAFLNGTDRELIRRLKEKFPELKAKAPGDFVILEN